MSKARRPNESFPLRRIVTYVLIPTVTHMPLSTTIVGQNVTREQLKSASEILHTASEEVSSQAAKERLAEQADHIETLAEADRGPDHGRLARHEHALEEIKALLGPEHEGSVDEALEEMRSYRETVEGV